MARFPIKKSLRFEVFKRDGFKCRYCGKQPPEITLCVDHVIAVIHGGTNDLHNLCTSCYECNSGKGARKLTSTLPGSEDAMVALQERLEDLRAMKCQSKLAQSITKEESKIKRRLSRAWFNATGLNSEDSFINAIFKRLQFIPIDEMLSLIRSCDSNMPKWTGYTRRAQYFYGAIRTVLLQRGIDSKTLKPVSGRQSDAESSDTANKLKGDCHHTSKVEAVTAINTESA